MSERELGALRKRVLTLEEALNARNMVIDKIILENQQMQDRLDMFKEMLKLAENPESEIHM
ncbi:MAG: hypothetical protein KKE62_10855 [Proteobacteria bacterium]|jgi:Mg2+ and Co2+ transporter CorA|nr:hypothetical protein [Pseudomonadota bacterium]MBU1543327.1 hypothetical protein [Pseudomonadota bacterium]MBU2482560.1 hypothetical protein [Pseudomonadota bacterium]